jgi:hypothetical protein
MNLQQLLDYRATCFIHGKPMKPHFKKKTGFGAQMVFDFILLERTELGLETRVKDKVPAPGGLIGFDGSISMRDQQNALRRIITQPFSVFMLCDTCVGTPIYNKDTTSGDFDFTVKELQKECHFYSFIVNPNFVLKDLTDTVLFSRALDKTRRVADFIPEREVIMHTRDLKFYHMVAKIPEGNTRFRMGTCDAQATLDTLLKGYMEIDAKGYSAANIKCLDQLVNKIRLYNLFS